MRQCELTVRGGVVSDGLDGVGRGQPVDDLDLVEHQRDTTLSAAGNVPDLIDLKRHLDLVAHFQERDLEVKTRLGEEVEQPAASVYDAHVSFVDLVRPRDNLQQRVSKPARTAWRCVRHVWQGGRRASIPSPLGCTAWGDQEPEASPGRQRRQQQGRQWASS